MEEEEKRGDQLLRQIFQYCPRQAIESSSLLSGSSSSQESHFDVFTQNNFHDVCGLPVPFFALHSDTIHFVTKKKDSIALVRLVTEVDRLDKYELWRAIGRDNLDDTNGNMAISE